MLRPLCDSQSECFLERKKVNYKALKFTNVNFNQCFQSSFATTFLDKGIGKDESLLWLCYKKFQGNYFVIGLIGEATESLSGNGKQLSAGCSY